MWAETGSDAGTVWLERRASGATHKEQLHDEQLHGKTNSAAKLVALPSHKTEEEEEEDSLVNKAFCARNLGAHSLRPPKRDGLDNERFDRALAGRGRRDWLSQKCERPFPERQEANETSHFLSFHEAPS